MKIVWKNQCGKEEVIARMSHRRLRVLIEFCSRNEWIVDREEYIASFEAALQTPPPMHEYDMLMMANRMNYQMDNPRRTRVKYEVKEIYSPAEDEYWED